MSWLKEFASACKQCLEDGGGPDEIRSLVQQALSMQAANPGQDAIDEIVYRSEDLLIVSLAQPPHGETPIHDHGIWGVIGIADGSEENVFFRQTEHGPVEINRRTVNTGEAIILGAGVIHKIRNPQATRSLGLHVYGGALLSAERHMWDPRTGERLVFEQSRFEGWCEALTAAGEAMHIVSPAN
ncbi:MAG: cysteine dioxygenase family protein [Collimonas sp.]|uniref:cysteine dioxygenase family protein n=1 Tax=Collimonas sp. TaxID=1963772 RepID=UPI003267A10B